jgi:predicted TIM-barrel fold metal-dependent hydrolase
VKVSTLPIYTSDRYPFRAVHSYVRRVHDSFGPERMLWGGDLSRLPCPYRQAITMFTEEMRWLSAEDKSWIMGRAACEWLRWPIAESIAA